MKQGSGRSVIGQRKIEPLSKGINPERVAQIGVSTSFQKPSMHAGRGYSAPKATTDSRHRSGSQGKH